MYIKETKSRNTSLAEKVAFSRMFLSHQQRYNIFGKSDLTYSFPGLPSFYHNSLYTMNGK